MAGAGGMAASIVGGESGVSGSVFGSISGFADGSMYDSKASMP